jgi:hypothetical protein
MATVRSSGMASPTTVPLLVAFLLVAAAEVGVGGTAVDAAPRRSGRCAGAAPGRNAVLDRLRLPYGPVLGLLRTVLVVLGRREAAGATDAVSTPGSDESERT